LARHIDSRTSNGLARVTEGDQPLAGRDGLQAEKKTNAGIGGKKPDHIAEIRFGEVILLRLGAA
jgi:hypothetical protein